MKFGGQSQSVNGHMMLDVVGVFGDYYFDPTKGMHAEALVDVGVLGFADSNGNSSNNDPSGVALGLGFGNDWWVSDEWSIGALGSFIYAPLSYSAGGATAKYSTVTPAVWQRSRITESHKTAPGRFGHAELRARTQTAMKLSPFGMGLLMAGVSGAARAAIPAGGLAGRIQRGPQRLEQR